MAVSEPGDRRERRRWRGRVVDERLEGHRMAVRRERRAGIRRVLTVDEITGDRVTDMAVQTAVTVGRLTATVVTVDPPTTAVERMAEARVTGGRVMEMAGATVELTAPRGRAAVTGILTRTRGIRDTAEAEAVTAQRRIAAIRG